jgi:hypothetical protein
MIRGPQVRRHGRPIPLAFHPRHPLSCPPHATTAEESITVAEQVYKQAKLLPQPLAQEALDFVLFLRARLTGGVARSDGCSVHCARRGVGQRGG